MAWYTGTYSCGHEDRVQIYGPVKDREWQAERIFSGLCPNCKQEKWNKENQKATETAKEMALPDLQGSEKQVAWANKIRLDMLDQSTEHLNRIVSKAKTEEMKNKLKQSVELIRNHITQNKTSAGWFIDRRYDSFSSIITEIMETEPEIKKLLEEIDKGGR